MKLEYILEEKDFIDYHLFTKLVKNRERIWVFKNSKKSREVAMVYSRVTIRFSFSSNKKNDRSPIGSQTRSAILDIYNFSNWYNFFKCVGACL